MTPPTPPPAKKRPSARISRLIYTSLALFGILMCVFVSVIGLSAGGGALAGQRDRGIQATQTTVADIDAQFALVEQDLAQGQPALAAERLAWIAERQPDYPGLAERQAQVDQSLSSTQIIPEEEEDLAPSAADDPTALLEEARAFRAEEEWASALARLDQLAQQHPTFTAEGLDDLRLEVMENLGLIYIRNGRLEEGLVLLDRARSYGALSDAAEGEYIAADLYSQARAYRGLDWPRAIAYYEEIYTRAPSAPTIIGDLAEAHRLYGKQLEAGDPCGAAAQYERALTLIEDQVLRTSLERLQAECQEAPSTPADLPPGVTATPGGPAPVPTPTLDFVLPTPVLPGAD